MDVKLGGLFAELAYNPDPDDSNMLARLPAGWVEITRNGYPPSGTEGAFVVYRNTNPADMEIVVAFKGTNTFGEGVDDIFKSGRTTIGNVVGRATDIFDNEQNGIRARFPDYTNSVGDRPRFLCGSGLTLHSKTDARKLRLPARAVQRERSSPSA